MVSVEKHLEVQAARGHAAAVEEVEMGGAAGGNSDQSCSDAAAAVELSPELYY